MTGKMFAIAALGALAAAAPASAQWNGGAVDIGGLRARIDDGVARGNLSPDDAAELRSQLRGLVDLQRRYAEDGYNGTEREDLRQRAQGLRNEIAEAEGEGYGRDDNRPAYGNGSGYNGGNQGAYGNRYGGSGYDSSGNRSYGNVPYGNAPYGGAPSGPYRDRSEGTYGNAPYGNGSYGNAQYDRDDAGRDDNYRSDGRYDRDNADRDEDEDGDALRVGDRANGNLYAVPNAYRTRFRDGGGVYYRYGGGTIYQIDGRTGVVLRIYPIDR
ncbi:MAG TPA: hypothetical protein VGF77_13890 [Allosphingosinicella sp.]